MATATSEVIRKAAELVAGVPEGIRYSEIHRRIAALLPSVPANTIHGALHKFRTDLPPDIYLPSRGLYRHVNHRESDTPSGATRPLPKGVKEKAFYAPFAEWLVNELEECTKAIPVGGSVFRDKWGTPDVIGIREPRRSDIIKPPTEIVAAEIKLDVNGLITAFGQACAYKLFSHRSYIVVPESSSGDDISRLDALARIFGVGLILFDTSDP
jgi:hypothetical protein